MMSGERLAHEFHDSPDLQPSCLWPVDAPRKFSLWCGPRNKSFQLMFSSSPIPVEVGVSMRKMK
jgi:hypothetical protein